MRCVCACRRIAYVHFLEQLCCVLGKARSHPQFNITINHPERDDSKGPAATKPALGAAHSAKECMNGAGDRQNKTCYCMLCCDNKNDISE